LVENKKIFSIDCQLSLKIGNKNLIFIFLMKKESLPLIPFKIKPLSLLF